MTVPWVLEFWNLWYSHSHKVPVVPCCDQTYKVANLIWITLFSTNPLDQESDEAPVLSTTHIAIKEVLPCLRFKEFRCKSSKLTAWDLEFTMNI